MLVPNAQPENIAIRPEHHHAVPAVREHIQPPEQPVAPVAQTGSIQPQGHQGAVLVPQEQFQIVLIAVVLKKAAR